MSKSDRETVDIVTVRASEVSDLPAGAAAPEADAEPVAPVAPPYSLENAQEYVIESGDSLSEISDKFGVSIADIKAANKISNVNKIRAGQTLLLPGEQPAVAPEATGTEIEVEIDEEGEEPEDAAGDGSVLELPRIESGP